jgi:hypothetical protein
MVYRYVNRPIEIEALQWDGDNREEVFSFCKNAYVVYGLESLDPVLNIYTLEGVKKADIGDYIIKGVEGEFYTCKKEIFNLTYIICNGK